ncbi:uncharacterized protein VTP21DRAFT_8530 [Calcarisporiella thermophila]|uniref:uncharacterized protein n=1 Tax=Calcarisporiella thermophila TaxID=911321 RepID=UPI00374225DA
MKILFISLHRKYYSSNAISRQYWIFLILAYVVYLLVKYRDRAIGTRTKGRRLRGPRGLPLLGNTMTGLMNERRYYDLLQDENNLYGPTYSVTLPFMRIVFISDFENLEHVLKTNFQNYTKKDLFYSRLSPLFGDGILIIDGAHWKLQRKTALTIFNVRAFREMITGIFREGSAHVAQLLEDAADNQRDIDLHDLFLRFTLDTFGKISFSIDFNLLENPAEPAPFPTAFDYLQHKLEHRFRNPLYLITEFFSGSWWKMREAMKVIDNFIYDMIAERRGNRSSPREKKDLLDMFLDYRDEEGQALDKKELRDIMVNFLVAGRDTTAQQLSWQYLAIMQHPAIQQKMREEILQFDPDQIDYDTLRSLHYCNSVFNETLRLYPSVPKNGRFAVEDDLLPDGTEIKKGDVIAYSSYVIGRLQKLWGDDAMQFKPERWLERDEGGNVKGVRRESPFKFPVFSAGPRICLGMNFATLESLTLTTQLLSRFEFELSPRFLEQESKSSHPLYGVSITFPFDRPLWVRVKRC